MDLNPNLINFITKDNEDLKIIGRSQFELEKKALIKTVMKNDNN